MYFWKIRKFFHLIWAIAWVILSSPFRHRAESASRVCHRSPQNTFRGLFHVTFDSSSKKKLCKYFSLRFLCISVGVTVDRKFNKKHSALNINYCIHTHDKVASWKWRSARKKERKKEKTFFAKLKDKKLCKTERQVVINIRKTRRSASE